MFYSLFLSRKATAGALALALLLGATGGDAVAQGTPLNNLRPTMPTAPATATIQPDDSRLLAHHEGATSAATSLLADGVGSGSDSGSILESLWGSLLVSMAYRRDPAIKALIKKMNRSNNAFLLSIAGVSGLGLAQNITVLSTLNSNTGSGHHDEEGGHASGGHRESISSSIMGLVGSGITLGSIGVHVYMERRYKKQIEQRQGLINGHISEILEQLEQGPATDQTQAALAELVGERAAREFIQLWTTTHPTPR